jgi:preprotein translocase subunit YajC
MLGGIEGFLPIVLIFVVFYFLLIRPQQKRAKQHREMLTNIRRGDRVLTGGGLYGTITKVVSDSEVVVQIAEAVKVRVARGTIAEVISRTEPAKVEKADKDEKSTA